MNQLSEQAGGRPWPSQHRRVDDGEESRAPRAWSSTAGTAALVATRPGSGQVVLLTALPWGTPAPQLPLPRALRRTRGGRGRRPLWTGLVGAGITKGAVLGVISPDNVRSGKEQRFAGCPWAVGSSCRDAESRTETVTETARHTREGGPASARTRPQARPHGVCAAPPTPPDPAAAVSFLSPRPPPRPPGGTALQTQRPEGSRGR